jgi:hypothetical protein
LLAALKRERYKVGELNIKIGVLKKEYANKVQRISQLQKENDDLIEQLAKLQIKVE